MRLDVEAIPEIVNIFTKSKNVSYMNGITHFLMRRQLKNRKRKIHDIEMDLNEETKNEIKNYKEKINDLQKEIEQYQRTDDDLLQDKEKLCKLYEYRVIESYG